MKLPIKNMPKRKLSLISSISTMWILTGVILLIVGIWAIMLYFVLSPYKSLLTNAPDNPVYERVLYIMDLLWICGGVISLFAGFVMYVGVQFKRFKERALQAVGILSYVMIILSGVGGVLWVKLWQFAIDFAPKNAEPGIWAYFGLFIGLCVILFYIAIMIYFIRAIRTKQFRDAYRNKIMF